MGRRQVGDTRTRRINRPKLFGKGFNHGIITEFGEVEIPGKQGSVKEQADDSRWGYRAIVKTIGVTGDKVDIWLWLGLNLNDKPIKTTGRGNKQTKLFNLFTTFCLRTDLIAEDELYTADEERITRLDTDMEGLVGQWIEFKSEMREKVGTDFQTRIIDVSTIRVLPESETQGDEYQPDEE